MAAIGGIVDRAGRKGGVFGQRQVVGQHGGGRAAQLGVAVPQAAAIASRGGVERQGAVRKLGVAVPVIEHAPAIAADGDVGNNGAARQAQVPGVVDRSAHL